MSLVVKLLINKNKVGCQVSYQKIRLVVKLVIIRRKQNIPIPFYELVQSLVKGPNGGPRAPRVPRGPNGPKAKENKGNPREN